MRLPAAAVAHAPPPAEIHPADAPLYPFLTPHPPLPAAAASPCLLGVH
jgi:hypothetical protein